MIFCALYVPELMINFGEFLFSVTP
jgi:hypothetical protein